MVLKTRRTSYIVTARSASDAFRRATLNGAELQSALEESETTHTDYSLPSDTYGLMVLTLAQFLTQQKNIKRMLVGAFIFFLNLALQLGLAYIMFITTVESAEDPYENNLRGRTANLTGAVQNQMRLVNYSLVGDKTRTSFEASTVDLCLHEKAAMRGVWPVYYMVLLLWFSAIIQEVSDTLWLMLVIWRVPAPGQPQDKSGGFGVQAARASCREITTESDSDSADCSSNEARDDLEYALTVRRPSMDMLDSFLDAKGSRPYITQLNGKARWTILLLVGALKLMTALCVMWVGAKFLALAQSTATLIIKALALRYILTIDEILFLTYASAYTRAELEATKVVFWRRAPGPWQFWLSSVVRLVGTVLPTIITLKLIFGHVMLFRAACREYVLLFPPPHEVGAGITFFLF